MIPFISRGLCLLTMMALGRIVLDLARGNFTSWAILIFFIASIGYLVIEPK